MRMEFAKNDAQILPLQLVQAKAQRYSLQINLCLVRSPTMDTVERVFTTVSLVSLRCHFHLDVKVPLFLHCPFS